VKTFECFFLFAYFSYSFLQPILSLASSVQSFAQRFVEVEGENTRLRAELMEAKMAATEQAAENARLLQELNKIRSSVADAEETKIKLSDANARIKVLEKDLATARKSLEGEEKIKKETAAAAIKNEALLNKAICSLLGENLTSTPPSFF
jgi:septal ring factor EnvC (AmiA/AmiB activator)